MIFIEDMISGYQFNITLNYISSLLLILMMPMIFMESIEADADSIPFSMISIENMISGFVPTSIQYLPQLHSKSSPFRNTNALRQNPRFKNTSKSWNLSDFISQTSKNTSKRWNLSDFISQTFAVV